MNHLLTNIFKSSLAFLILSLLTACLSPTKVKKVIQMSEDVKVYEKFEKLFNQSVNKQKTNLLFSGAVDHKFGTTIYLDLRLGMANSNWVEDVMKFQKKLNQTQTDYQFIEVNDGRGPTFVYIPENLKVYELSYKLFQENLDQIKENRIADLYKTMGNTDLEYATVKELFDYVNVTNLKEFELVLYPSDDVFDYERVVFCLNATKTSKLYFSYVSIKSELVLYAVDLNDGPKEINLNNLFDRLKNSHTFD